MGLSIEVELLLGRFEASDGHDGTPPEWPPAPARVFAALVAGCEAEHSGALRWLEQQGPPTIYASEAVTARPHGRWLVTNPAAVSAAKSGSAQHPGRTNVVRARQRCWPADPRVVYTWPAAQPTATVLAELEDAARRVGYLGRPTSPALVRVTVEPPRPRPVQHRLDPAEPDSFDQQRLRTIYPSFFDSLCAAFAANTRVDPPVYDDYAPAREIGVADPEKRPSPWAHFLVFQLDADAYIPGERAVQLAAAFRAALLARIGEDIPPVVAGHDVPPPHCAFLALPHVGHPHADGHVLGIALAVPAADAGTIAAIRDGLSHPNDSALGITLRNVPGFAGTKLRFRRATRSSRVAWALRPERWCRPSRVWRTVLPAVLDRAPSRRVSVEDAVVLTIQQAGFPVPRNVAVSRAPWLAGDLALRPSQTKRTPNERTRPFRHLLIEFDQPVRGPLLLGAKRHFGLGLCAPTRLLDAADGDRSETEHGQD